MPNVIFFETPKIDGLTCYVRWQNTKAILHRIRHEAPQNCGGFVFDKIESQSHTTTGAKRRVIFAGILWAKYKGDPTQNLARSAGRILKDLCRQNAKGIIWPLNFPTDLPCEAAGAPIKTRRVPT